MNRISQLLKKLLALIIFPVFLVSLPTVTTADQEKFTVGLILPLSGGLADYGEALRHGFELAEADYPELFKHIELRYEDSKYEEKTALSAFYSLEQKGGVDLYHVWGVSPNAAILPISNAKKRPALSETSMRSAGKDRPYVVVASRTGYAAAQNLVNTFAAKGWKHVGLIITQIPYYTDIADALVELGKQKNIQIELYDQVAPSDHDFKSILTRTKNKDIDAIGPLLLADQILSFCNQANALHYAKPIFGAHIHNSAELMKQCLPLSEGAFFPGVIVSQDFRRRYAERFGTELRIDSAAGSYETAKIIAQLFGKTEKAKLTPEEIIARFKTVNEPNSSIGSFAYSETPEGGQAINFSEIVLSFEGGNIGPIAK